MITRAQVWKDYEEPKDEAVILENEPTERSLHYTTVVVTELCDDLHFYAQNVDQGEHTTVMTGFSHCTKMVSVKSHDDFSRTSVEKGVVIEQEPFL